METLSAPQAAREPSPRAAFALAPAAFAWLPYAVLLVWGYAVFCVTPDDPYITYRYAANLLAGHGPVFNIGERVEGFSSPLHLLLSAVLLRLVPTLDILFKAKLLGLLFALLAVWQTGGLARQARFAPGFVLLAQLLVAANIMFAQAAVNGLETTLYAFLLLVTLRAFVREAEGAGGVRSAILLFIALLARPEAVLLFVALLLLRFVWGRQDGWAVKHTVVWAAWFLLPAALLVGARLLYYGEPVPNTYFAKNMPVATGVASGLRYLLHPVSLAPVQWSGRAWLHPKQLVSILGMLAFWALAVWGWARQRSRLMTVLAAAVLMQAVFVLRSGGDWMPGWRFFAPLVPVLAVLQCSALRALALPDLRRLRPLAAAVLLLWTLCALASPHAPWSRARFSTHGDTLMACDTSLGRKWVATAHFIRRLPPGVSIAYSELGLAGYTNLDKTFIDTRGLTDRAIARLPKRTKHPWGVDDPQWTTPGDPLYTILSRRRPDVIIAFTRDPQMPRHVLTDYVLTDAVADPRDRAAEILPALIYRRTPAATPLTSAAAGR